MEGGEGDFAGVLNWGIGIIFINLKNQIYQNWDILINVTRFKILASG